MRVFGGEVGLGCEEVGRRLRWVVFGLLVRFIEGAVGVKGAGSGGIERVLGRAGAWMGRLGALQGRDG